MVTLFDKLERLRGNSVDSAVAKMPTTRELADVMGGRAEAKSYQDILIILDRYLLSRQRFQQVLAGTRGRKTTQQRSSNSSISIQIAAGSRSNYIQIQYPKANQYFDEGSIQLLRAAYEYYRHDDLLSDLFAHFQKQTIQAESGQRVYAHLALCYLNWWNGDKAESAEELAEVTSLVPDDMDLRLELARQMHQLGMHEMSEAVLARTRRKAGNRMQTLVSLMQQYSQQGKGEIAIQVAHQILRRAKPARASMSGSNNNDAQAVQQAIQILARSNQLEEVITRLENQLENSPKSLPLHHKLISYYRASKKKDKAQEMQKRILAMRPDGMKLRYQMAQEMEQQGDRASAVEQYLVVLKKEPALLGRNFYRVQSTFQQAKMLDEFVTALEEVDLKSMGQYHVVGNVIQQLVQKKQNQAQGMKLFRRAWEAFPNERVQLVRQIAYMQQL